MKCISCGLSHNEQYCPNCGERNGVERITISTILGSTFSTITNMDKGFLFNLKSLFLKPRKITTDYISGKRKGILNPISYLIFSITIYLVVIAILKTPSEPRNISTVPKPELGKIAYEVGFFIHKYIKYFWILSIIPLGLSLKLVFKKYNYPEHIAISAFIIAQATIIGILSYLLFRIPLILDPIIFISIFILIFRIFKKNNNTIELLLMTLGASALFIIQCVLILVIIGIIKA